MADAIVHCLRELELRYVFGVSGANIEHLHDAIHRLGNGKLSTIITKSESGAAFMADARARTHDTIGVCCASSGGGMMNLAVGIAESLAQGVPILALVGQAPLAHEGRGGFQDSSGKGSTLDALGMWKAISKYACKVRCEQDFWPFFFEALTQPLNGRQGPAVMLLPRDMMTADVGDVPEGFVNSVQLDRPAHKYGDKVDRLWKMLARAKNPVLVLGSAVAREHAERQAQDFAKSINIKVVSTMSSPGVFPNDDINYLGMIGVSGHPSAHDFIKHTTDLVVAVGTQLRVMTRISLEEVFSAKPLVVVNRDLASLNDVLKADLTIQSGILTFFQHLQRKQQESPLNFSGQNGHNFVTRFTPQKLGYPSSDDVSGHESYKDSRVADAGTQSIGGEKNSLALSAALGPLNDCLPQRGHILFDAGNCGAAAAHYLKIPAGAITHMALGMAGMGYAVAGAIGAQLGEDDGRRTMVLCGDGAFMITGLEIHTAVDLKLPILWVVFNNNMHGMCVTRQHLYFSGRVEGSTYSDIDIAKIARGFGSRESIWSKCATSEIQLREALDEYHSHFADIPGVLEIKISNDELPPFVPFLSNDAASEKAW